MFNDQIAHEIVDAASNAGIEPACLLAMVEVETGGKAFEQDGRTPAFLYERHVAYREATKRGCLNAFTRAGLAIPHWDKATQYRDQRTSAQRLELMQRAKAIDPEVACRSASWGLGQTMGNLAEELNYASAVLMVASLTDSIPGQLDAMIRELRHTDLIKSLNAHDWTRVARVYNGPSYAANQYDVKLRDAHRRWSRKVEQLNQPAPPEQSLARDEIKTIQQDLRDLGYYEVGTVDGVWGSRTTGALSAFQHHEGLPVTGHYDEQTREALLAAEIPRPIEPARKTATVDDLRESGSDTIKHADDLSRLGSAKVATGAVVAGGGALTQTLDHANDAADKIDQAKSVFERFHDILRPALAHPEILILGAILVAAGLISLAIATRIRANRLADHTSGVHPGPTE